MRRYKKKHKRLGKFKSSLEALVAKKLGRKAKYEPLKIKYFDVRHYTPDFLIKVGEKAIYLEVKGYLRYEDQKKMRMVKSSNPELDIRFYFPRDQKVQSSQMLNSQWCKKYDFPFCIGEIPNGWLQ